MRPVEFSPRAERQIVDIEVYYLSKAGPAAADEVVEAILTAAERLGSLPVIYRPAARTGLREYVLDRFPYILIYRVQPRRIQIVSIIHQRQDR